MILRPWIITIPGLTRKTNESKGAAEKLRPSVGATPLGCDVLPTRGSETLPPSFTPPAPSPTTEGGDPPPRPADKKGSRVTAPVTQASDGREATAEATGI